MPGEVFPSFLARNAAILLSSPEQLLASTVDALNGVMGSGPDLALRLTLAPEKEAIEYLARMFSTDAKAISHLFPRCIWPHVKRRDLTAVGGAKPLDGIGTLLSDKFRYGWCQQCLLEDRAGGKDHFIRQHWISSYTTICPVHNRPLNGYCASNSCRRQVSQPIFVDYGKSLVLSCPECHLPLDSPIGVDFVTQSNARQLLNHPEAVTLYRQLANMEAFLLDGLCVRTPRSKRHALANRLLKCCNLMLRAEFGNALRAIDCYANTFIRVPVKLGAAVRDLSEPFPAATLVERRKSIALLSALITNQYRAYGFNRPAVTLEQFGDAMTRDLFEQFQRNIYDIAQMALPANLEI